VRGVSCLTHSSLVTCNPVMAEHRRPTFAWLDLVWLVFLVCLAILRPIGEIHKQLVLVGIGLFQIFESDFVRLAGRRGREYSVFIKILLATLLVGHTGEIDSSYYLIYYLPVVTAAMYYGAVETLLWTSVAAVAYCSYLIPALQENPDSDVDVTELVLRNLFLFLVAIVVNRVVTESRRQAETLKETNRRLEQAQAEARRSERLAALGQLSAGLAHELRNPLGVIKGSAEILSKKIKPDDPLATEMATNISLEVNRLNVLVSRFLDFARPSQLQKHAEDLPAIVDRSLKAVHDRWPAAPVEIERQYAPNLPPVPVDAELCEQVFTNLFLNAYEALAGSGGKIRVAITGAKATPRGEDGTQRGVLVEIEDDGPGIPPELREQIFNPFFTTKKSGVGLGLSIVSKIVDDHRGWIRLCGPAGSQAKGACFEVFFPAE
jgi:two-component system sensor histidine kinase HydH